MDQNDLLARLTALEATVETLQRQLGQRSSTMKRTLRCSCGGTRILQFFRIFEIGHNQRYELSLVSRINVWTGAKTSAPLEVYVCRSCRLVEWHATSFDGVKVDGTSVVEHVAPPDDAPGPAPYR